MNKVFKVIWSEARNAYVVVSEMAKSHGTKSCSTKKLLAMLIATGVMTCASVAPVMAEDAVNLAPDATKIAIGEGAVASGKGSVVAIGQKASASGEGSVAIGASSVADRKSRVVGLYAPDEDKDSLTWKANAGAVSVGSSVEGEEITRQITNVAAGSADTDAVNVAQLNAVKAAAGKKVSLVDGENTKATLVKDDATGTQYKVDVDLSKYAKTEDVAVVYDKDKTSLRSTNASVAENAIALGKGASAVKNSIAIGNGASVVAGSNGSSGVALGYKAHAGYKGTSLGSNAISGREGTTLVGANTNSGSLYTTVVGTDSVINSDGTAYKVKIDTLFGTYEKDVNIQGATATLVGTSNKVDNKNNLVYSGVANNVMGAANTIEASNGVTIQGTGNKVTDAYKDMNINTNEGLAILGGDYSVLAKKQSGAIAVVGGANTVSKQTDSTVIGYDNKLTGGEENISHDVFMAGSHNRLNNVSDSIVMGNKNAINGVSNVISFGHQNEITANNAVAIGSGASVSVEGGVALGVGSVADRANAVSVGSTGANRQIINVAAGTEGTDAVNVSQLQKVSDTANKGWNLATNGVATEATNVKPGEYVDFSGDKNISVSHDGTNVKVELNDELKDIKSIIGAGEGAGSISFADGGIKLNNKVTINKDGKITGVAAGEVSSTSTDAVNGSQLHAVKTELQTSDKHLVGNPASADGYYKPDANGDISLRVEDQNKNGYDVVIKDVASKAELGDVANRVTNVENKVTQIETDVTTIKTDITTIKTDITTIKTDINNINTRVDNVEALAGKHTTLEKNGTNINVEESVVDGQKNYKVNLNKNITLGDENGNKVSISGTNGTITATGDITTANRINAANGGKLADIDVTGNKLSNGNSSITLDGTNVKVNDKVTVDKDGKISGVAKGDISNTSTDAVNGSQLYDTNTHITNVENQVISNSNRINQLGNRVNKVGAGAAALAALHPMDFDPDDKLTFSAGYGNYGGENAAAIGAYYRPDEKVMFSVAGTVGNGENMVNAGVSFALDRTNHVSNSRTALAREVIDLRGQLAVMGAKMAKMEKAFGMLDETKTKLFPDVPANHWAYEYIAKLAGNGYIEGYPDGNFGGDRLMTRYEFAAMLYRAIEKGAALEEKIIKEFEPELGRIRVDRISGEDGDRDKIERVRVNDTKGERDHYGNKLAK